MLLNPYRFGGGGDFASVKALLHMDGTDGSTSFPDVIGTTWTANGNAQVDTAQSVFGGASLLCDGTSDYIQSASGADIGFAASEDFTLEFRMRWNSVGVLKFPMGFGGSGTCGFQFRFSGSDVLVFYTVSGQIVSTTVFTTGAWYAIAITRASNTLRMFVNGTLEASAPGNSGSSGGLPGTFTIGSLPASGTNGHDGWIDEFRFTKGFARYTASYTPAASAFPDS